MDNDIGRQLYESVLMRSPEAALIVLLANHPQASPRLRAKLPTQGDKLQDDFLDRMKDELVQLLEGDVEIRREVRALASRPAVGVALREATVNSPELGVALAQPIPGPAAEALDRTFNGTGPGVGL